jgi:hypothetical protein
MKVSLQNFLVPIQDFIRLLIDFVLDHNGQHAASMQTIAAKLTQVQIARVEPKHAITMHLTAAIAVEGRKP